MGCFSYQKNSCKHTVLFDVYKSRDALNMNVNWVLDRNFSLLIGSADDWCVPWNKMDILKAVHYFTTITVSVFTISSLILYLRCMTATQ